MLLYDFVLVVPTKVEIDDFFRNDEQVGCNGTRRVKWQPIKTGSCSVEYTIDFRNSANDSIDTVENITGNSYCSSKYNNATSVIMWATYKGTSGIKSEAKLFTTTPGPTATTRISPATKKTGIELYVYFIFVSKYVFVYACENHEKKNS